MFTVTAPTTAERDDTGLEVTVTPSASAFYAGETFSAVISLRNTRVPINQAGPRPALAISTDNSQGLNLLPGARPTSESVESGWPSSPDRQWSPVTTPGGRTWRGEHARRPSGHGHTRRTQSLALGKGTLSPQELVWALGGDSSRNLPAVPIGPPPLPARRRPFIPSSHPHARQASIADSAFSSPPLNSTLRFGTPPLPSNFDTAPTTPTPEASALLEASPSLNSPDPSSSRRPCTSPSPSLPDVKEEAGSPATSPIPPGRLQQLQGKSASSAPVSPSVGAESPSFGGSFDASGESSADGSASSTPRRMPHGHAPSYHNAYGAGLLQPPVHPTMKGRPPSQSGAATVLWAHTRLIARFSPSHQYIPPDPLLPLRARLLQQPVGSGSLTGDDKPGAGSRWQISFGTGTVGQRSTPSFTGSLFGLAKGLVYGDAGGSLSEERKRVWNTQDLPVLETTRSLLGVDIRIPDGETREFIYTIQLPATLPPAFKGRALKFSYDLVVSLNVSLPGGGKRQRTKEITIPVRVWPNVSLHHPLRPYDVLEPVIQTTEQGSVSERPMSAPSTPLARRHQLPPEPPQPSGSLASYARRLIDTLEPSSGGGHRVPPSPTKPLKPLSPELKPLARTLSPTTPNRSTFNMSPASSSFLMAPSPGEHRLRPRSTSIVAADEELLEEGAQKCGEAVEILSRHSPKASYDIRQEGEVVAVLTLIKTTYRLGETVQGVVTFNEPHKSRRVLRLTAYLETHEVIPEPLLPPSASAAGRSRAPELRRVHAEARTSYAQNTSRTAFSLDIPSDATPAFALSAGDGRRGGLEWRVRISFLVATPPRAWHRRSGSREAKRSAELVDGPAPAGAGVAETSVMHLEPIPGDSDNAQYAASSGLVPFMANPDHSGGWTEARAETVECEVPVQVLAGNTAFVVRPTVTPV